jgi:hypothetical protein
LRTSVLHQLALAEVGGNKTLAAQILKLIGIAFKTKKYGWITIRDDPEKHFTAESAEDAENNGS